MDSGNEGLDEIRQEEDKREIKEENISKNKAERVAIPRKPIAIDMVTVTSHQRQRQVYNLDGGSFPRNLAGTGETLLD